MEKFFETFKEIDEIEDTFDLTDDGIKKMDDYVNTDTFDEVEDVIDPDAETEEDVQDSYIGKIVLQCPVCKTFMLKAINDIDIDENQEWANVDSECPYCYSAGGFKILGEIASIGCGECDDDNKEDTDEEEKDTEVEEETEEAETLTEGMSSFDKIAKGLKRKYGIDINGKGVDESLDGEELKESVSERDDIDAEADNKKEKAKKTLKKKIDDADADRDYKLKKKGLKEDFKNVTITTDDQHMEMSADESGKVTVTTEPTHEETFDEFENEQTEIIAPVSDNTAEDIVPTKEEESDVDGDEIDVDIDEFDEEDFDQLGESYLKEVYDNVKSFKTTKGELQGNKLILEGKIAFNSGKQAKTQFIFEGLSITKTGKVKFLGENKQITNNKKAFTLTGRMNGNKLLTESLTYNYRGVDAKTNKSTRLYGTVKVK